MNKLLTLSIAALFSTGVYAAGESDPAAGQEWTPGSQPGQTTSAISFDDADTNKDGHISKDEAKNVGDLATNFDQYDQNQDQQLDQSEFAQFEVELQQKGEQMQQQPTTPEGEQPGGGGM